MVKKNIYKNNIFFIILFFFIIFDYNFSSLNVKHFSWDEVNFSKASSLGLLENAFEFESKNFYEFIKIGYDKIYNNKNLITQANINIINNEKNKYDIFELRHYHPPLYTYYLSIFHSFNSNEIIDSDLRVAHKFISYFIIVFLFLCCLLMKKNKNNLFRNSLCLIVLIIFFYSDIFQQSLNNLNFHLLFSLTIIFYSYSLYKYILKNNFKNLLRFSFSTAVIFLSLETAIFLFLSSFAYIFFYYKHILINKKFLYLLFFILVFF